MDFDDTNLRHVMFMPVTALSSYCRAKCSKVAETLCNTLTRKEKKEEEKRRRNSHRTTSKKPEHFKSFFMVR